MKAKTKKTISDDEAATWQLVVKDVKPLKKKRTIPPPPRSVAELAKKPIKPKAAPVLRVATRAAYDVKIDLHGMTEAGAYAVLMDFMRAQIKRGARRILVITGKGSGNSSVLRANMPRWLEIPSLERHISAVEQAPLALGGAGAFLVRLKKPR